MALFSDRYYARKNGTEAANASSASRSRKGSFSERYYADKYMRSIGVDTFDSDLKTTNDLLTSVYTNWQDSDSMTANRETVSSMRNRLNDLYSYTRFSGQDTTEIKKVLDAYNTALSEWDGLTEYYGGFKSGDAYANYMEEQARKEELSKQSAFDEYRHLLEDEDFMKNANYESAKKNMSFWDHLTDKSDLYEVNKENKDGLLYDIDHALGKAFPVESTKYQYLTDDELSVYYGLHALDKNQADDFLDKMSKELNKRMTDADIEGQREFAQMNGFTGTIATIGALGNNLIGGISALNSDIKNFITGKETDANDFAHIYTNRADALREAVSEDIGESTDTKVLPFLYDTGMSIANSALNIALLGGSGSLANMSTQAYSSKMKEMQDRGASQTEMILTSALAAGIEAITEKIPMDNLLKPKGVTTLRRFIGETMKQAGIEATEEGVSSILNQTVDVLSGQLGGTSELKNQYEDYLLRGYTEDEAKKEVAKGALEETLLSALGGAISGGIMGGVGNAVEGAENRNIGKFVTNNNRLPELTDLATEVGPIGEGKNAVDYAAQLQNSPNKATIGYAYKNIAEEANRQADELDRSETKELITRRLVEMGESGETAMDLADAIIADGNGKASAAQRRMIKNSGIAAEAIEEIKNNAEWTTKSTEGLRKAQGLRDKLKSISTMRDASVVKAEQRAAEMNISDTTTDIETGKEIDIEGVRFDENGEAVLQTSEGERKLSEVTLTSSNAIAIAYAEDMDREMADTFVSLYDGKQDFEEYKDSFNLVWNYGQDGYGSDSVLSHLGNLTESQALSIYKAGMTSEVAKAQKAVNAIKKQYQGFAVKGSFDDSIIDYTGADSNKVNFNALSDNQKQNIVAAKAIAEGLGLKVELFSSKHGENKANGYYDPKTNTIGIDVFAEQKGGSLNNGIMTAMSHEMTHWMKDKSPKLYNEMRELVMNGLSKASGVSGDVLARIEAYRMDSRHGGNASDSQAIDELIARACEDMLSNSKVAKSILENMSAESRAGFVDKIKEFLSKIKEAIASIMGRFDSESREAVMLREMDGMADKMAEMWDSMLEDSMETNSAMAEEAEEDYLIAASDKQLAERGIATNGEMATMFSVKYVLNEEKKEEVALMLVKRLGVTKEEAMKYLTAETSLASVILNPKYSEYLTYEADDGEVAIKTNSDYPQGTVDFSNICAKRRGFTSVMNKIMAKFKNHVFFATDLAKIRSIMSEVGVTVPCGICYVEDRRQLDSQVAEDFQESLRLYRNGSTNRPDGKPFNANQLKALQQVKNDDYIPSIYELITLEGRNELKKKNPVMESAWVKFNNARGMQSVRLLLNEAEYKREILKYSKATVKSKNDYGGLRLYSFSDAEMQHLIDIIQVLTDCSAVGLCAQGYTKVNEYAKAVKDTREKINRSLIPLGDLGYHIENGRVVLDYDTVEGIDINSKDFFDNTDSPDVGNVTIGINDVQIRAAMTDTFVDYIIPFHTGQSEAVLKEKKINNWKNYKYAQSELDIKTGKKSNKQINIYTDVIKAAENEGNPIKNKVQFVEKFLKVCKENGLVPRFAEFLNTDANGDYVYTEGYHKFIIDFKMFDQRTGEYLPQLPVVPKFNDSYIKKLLINFAKNEAKTQEALSADLQKVVKRIEKEVINADGRQYSDKDSSYLDAVNRGDMETAQKMVDEAAKKAGAYVDSNGNIVRMLHGTNMKFNTFDAEMTLVGSYGYGHYFSSNQSTSDSYGKRSISAYLMTNRVAEKGSHNITANQVREFLWAYDREERNTTMYYADSTEEWLKGRDDLKVIIDLHHWAREFENGKSTTDVLNDTVNILGYDAMHIGGINYWVVYDNKLIKSADPVTYDDNGNIIPLSQRFNSADNDIRYSDKDSDGNGLTKEQVEYFKDSVVRDENGRLKIVYHGTYENFTVFKPNEYLTERNGGSNIVGYFSENKSYAEVYGYTKPYYLDIRNPLRFEDTAMTLDKWKTWLEKNGVIGVVFDSSVTGENGTRDTLKGANYDDGTYFSMVDLFDAGAYWTGDGNLTERIKAAGYDGMVWEEEGLAWMPFDASQVKLTTNTNPTEIEDIRYSDKDSEGTGLTDAQIRHFAESKMRDERGKLKPMYHGTNSASFTVFDASNSDDGISFFFTDKLSVASGYSGSYEEYAPKQAPDTASGLNEYLDDKDDFEVIREDGEFKLIRKEDGYVFFSTPNHEEMYEHILDEWADFDVYGARNYKVYLNITNPLIVDAKGREWNNIPLPKTKGIDRYNYIYTGAFNEADETIAFVEWEDMNDPSGDTAIEYNMKIEDFEAKFGSYVAEGVRNGLNDFEAINLDSKTKELIPRNTRQYAYFAKKNGYDGVIIRDVVDMANGTSLYESEPSTVAIVFNSNQIKSVANENPTDSDDIRYSDKGSDGEELGSYYKNLARKLERENDYLKIRHENYKARIEKARRIEQITKKATRMNNLLKKNSKDYHVPEILKEPLEAVLAALDFSSKSFLKKGEPTGKDVRLAEAFSNLQDVLIDIDKAQINEEDINGIYGHFDMPEGFVEYVRDVKQSINDTIGRMSGEPVVLNRLTKDELDNIYDILTILNKSITQMDKALSTTKAMRISAIADTSKNYLESIHKMGDELPLMQRMKKFLAWDNVLPVYGMSRFGEGGDIIMESLQNGWDKLAFNVDRVVKYSEGSYKKEQLKEWEKSTKTFTVANGNKRKEITLTDAQIMSLYCLSKRDQAMGHILGHGITIASHKTKSDGKIKFDKLTQKDHSLITEKELNTIVSSLSSEQVAVADALQKFMNTVCAEWGNQVSMVRFGIKSFGEENYFPIKSDSNVIESKASESGDSLFRLLNLSFTKSLTKNANNAIMVESVFDVFANHASDMAKYNALALPVLDAFKWYSAKGTVKDKSGKIVDSWSLKRTMDDAYGESAKGFVRGLLLDMNGASSGGQDIVADSIAKKMMSNYKVASVAANLRVAILQPTSYIRAGLVLDKKYLTQALVTKESTLKDAVKKATETCGIALWKSLGFYDTNISRGVTKLIKQDESALDVVKDKSLILAEKGDEITWGLLYRACLLEQKEKNPGMNKDELDKAVAERLREVIYKTQVVDSTLTRTQTMRSKSAWSQMLTSFMSEPSVSWSILSDVAFKWMIEARDGNHKRAFAKYGKQMKDATMTYLITATTAAILGAIPDAFRDDDEKKDFGEKFAMSAVQNLLSDVTGLLPYVRDIFNMAQGFQPSRMDQQAFSTIINGIRRLSDGEWTYKDIYTMVRGLSQASGIPVSNIMREIETVLNATVGNIYSKIK